MKEQKTAEQIIREKIKEYSASTVNIDVDNIPAFTHFLFVAIDAMQVYSDQQNAELDKMAGQLSAENSHLSSIIEGLKIEKEWLKERVKELEAKLTISKAYLDRIACLDFGTTHEGIASEGLEKLEEKK